MTMLSTLPKTEIELLAGRLGELLGSMYHRAAHDELDSALADVDACWNLLKELREKSGTPDNKPFLEWADTLRTALRKHHDDMKDPGMYRRMYAPRK